MGRGGRSAGPQDDTQGNSDDILTTTVTALENSFSPLNSPTITSGKNVIFIPQTFVSGQNF